MRILIANTRHFRGGGDSTYTFNLADSLRKAGHEVAFFAMQDPRNMPDENADLFVSYVDFKELNRRKSPLTGFQVLGRAIYSRESRQSFGRLLDRFQPDIVHLQSIHGHITPSIIFEAKKRRLPVVWTLHDYKLVCPNTHFLIDASAEICEACGRGRYYRAVLKKCKKASATASAVATLEAYAHRAMKVQSMVDLFLTPSSFLRDKIIEHGFSPGKTHHVPLFLPPEMFEDGGTDEGYILFLGKLDPIKGVRELLEAARLVPQVRLVLAGRVEEPLASELPILMPSNGTYVGMKQGEELRALLRGARAIVLPSVWYENQPFSILEAFACGKPVIASDLGGMTELVRTGERGLLVSPGDVVSLAEAMMWLSAHPKEAKLMGDQAREYASITHSAERHLGQLMDAYSGAIGCLRGETNERETSFMQSTSR